MKRSLLDRLNLERAARRPVALVTRISTGGQALICTEETLEVDLAVDEALRNSAEERLATDKSGVLEEEPDLFVQAFNPPLRLIIIGAVHIAQSLVPMARLAGYEVHLIDPRGAWATPERFPDIEVIGTWPDEAMERLAPDRRTAVAALCHDPKIDDPALAVALRSEAFYIGALGSRKTHAKRLARLSEEGFDEDQLARIHGPIGLSLGGRSPAEISIATLAQITQARHSHPSQRVGAVILAAGRSTRMGAANKLLEDMEGRPIIRRIVETVLATRAKPVIVVTGHESEAVATALDGCPVTLVHNAAFAEGLSGSLKCGIDALPETAEGAVICLGDMPRVTAGTINRLIDKFDPRFKRSIAVPTYRTRRGNPVLLGKSHFAEVRTLSGDVGARSVIAQHPDSTVEVAVSEEGILVDVDTPEALATLRLAGA